jgi:hypothetical protein
MPPASHVQENAHHRSAETLVDFVDVVDSVDVVDVH